MGGPGSGGKRERCGAKRKSLTTYYTTELSYDMKNKWVFLGEVYAKSGRVLIQDIDSDDYLHPKERKRIIEECDSTLAINYNKPIEGDLEIGADVEEGFAVEVPACAEDGYFYYVYGLIKNVQSIGLRIVEIKMSLVPTEVLDQCEPFDGEYEEYEEPSDESEEKE